MLPTHVIAGFTKCGTSSLFFWLTAHPDACGSKKKETYFLADKVSKHNRNLNLIEHGKDKYETLFEHCSGQKAILEATPVYVFQKKPIDFLSKMKPLPKIILIVRKPSDRLYSLYKFNKYRMKNMNYSFEEYLNSIKAGKWNADHIERTRYENYIKKWIGYFGKENVLVYLFEEMMNNKKTFMKKLAKDINIDPSFYDDFDFFHRNQTVAVKSKWIHNMGLKLQPLVPQKLQEKILPMYLKFNSSKVPGINNKEKELKKELEKEFNETKKWLKENYSELNINLWEE